MKITNVADLLGECFEEWQREALEFAVKGKPLTIDRQFLYYYRGADFDGTDEDLKVCLQMKIQDNLHYLYQLRDLITNIRQITTLDQYNSVDT